MSMKILSIEELHEVGQVEVKFGFGNGVSVRVRCSEDFWVRDEWKAMQWLRDEAKFVFKQYRPRTGLKKL